MRPFRPGPSRRSRFQSHHPSIKSLETEVPCGNSDLPGLLDLRVKDGKITGLKRAIVEHIQSAIAKKTLRELREMAVEQRGTRDTHAPSRGSESSSDGSDS